MDPHLAIRSPHLTRPHAGRRGQFDVAKAVKKPARALTGMELEEVRHAVAGVLEIDRTGRPPAAARGAMLPASGATTRNRPARVSGPLARH